MLAYSSVAHAGYMLVGLTAGGALGAGAVLFYLLVYTFTTAGAFGVVLLLERATGEGVSLADYAGLARSHGILALVLSLFLLSLIGIPPLGGFVGKFYLFGAAVRSGYVGLAVIGVLNSAVASYYYLRLIVYMYMREPEDAPRGHGRGRGPGGGDDRGRAGGAPGLPPEGSRRGRGRRARRRRDRRRHGRRGRRPRPRAPRRLGRALREGGLRLGHDLAVLQAHPRRPPLPRAVRFRAGAGVARRARDAASPRPASRAAAALPRPRLRRLRPRPDQGPDRPHALRPPGPGSGPRALPGPPARGRAGARAEPPGRGPARRRLLLRRSAALAGAPLPRERALRLSRGRAGRQLLRGRGGDARSRGHRGRARARPPVGPGAHGAGAGRRQRRRALGGPSARAGREHRARQARHPHHEGDPLRAAAPERTGPLRLHAGRPRGAGDPVARVLGRRHDRYRFRGRSRPRGGDRRGGRLPARRGASRPARPRSGGARGRVHVRRCAAAVVRGPRARLRRVAQTQGGRRGRRPVPVRHRDQADVLPEPRRAGGRPGAAHPRPPRRVPHGAARPRRLGRGGVAARGDRLAGRGARAGGDAARARDDRDPGGDLRPRLAASRRSRGQGAGR